MGPKAKGQGQVRVEGYSGGKKRRGNKNWTNPHLLTVGQARPTEFEQMLSKWGIPEAGCERYPQVQQWIWQHRHLRYIPEYLLKLCHAEVKWEDVNVY